MFLYVNYSKVKLAVQLSMKNVAIYCLRYFGKHQCDIVLIIFLRYDQPEVRRKGRVRGTAGYRKRDTATEI